MIQNSRCRFDDRISIYVTVMFPSLYRKSLLITNALAVFFMRCGFKKRYLRFKLFEISIDYLGFSGHLTIFSIKASITSRVNTKVVVILILKILNEIPSITSTAHQQCEVKSQWINMKIKYLSIIIGLLFMMSCTDAAPSCFFCAPGFCRDGKQKDAEGNCRRIYGTEPKKICKETWFFIFTVSYVC